MFTRIDYLQNPNGYAKILFKFICGFGLAKSAKLVWYEFETSKSKFLSPIHSKFRTYFDSQIDNLKSYKHQ